MIIVMSISNSLSEIFKKCCPYEKYCDLEIYKHIAWFQALIWLVKRILLTNGLPFGFPVKLCRISEARSSLMFSWLWIIL